VVLSFYLTPAWGSPANKGERGVSLEVWERTPGVRLPQKLHCPQAQAPSLQCESAVFPAYSARSHLACPGFRGQHSPDSQRVTGGSEIAIVLHLGLGKINASPEAELGG
jgi:hypothetical protein